MNTFSFRLFSATQLPDNILASRTIVVPLIRTPDRYRANADPMDYALWPHERQKLVDDLWLLALTHLPEMGRYEAAVNQDSALTGRNLEPWRALLAVAAWLDSLDKPQRSSETSEVSGLLERMAALSVSYQAERPNVEMSDMTALVIRALGLVVGRMVKEEGGNGDVGDGGDVFRKTYFILGSTITAAAQALVEAHELDLSIDHVNSRRIGHVLKRMRMTKARQGHTGKRGWGVSLADVVRWANSYGLESREITGLNVISSRQNVTAVTNVTNVTQAAANRWEGEL